VVYRLRRLAWPAVLVLLPLAVPGATTGEDTGASAPYPTQAGSNPGYPATGPMLVKDYSESDIRVDPTNPKHLIGSTIVMK
jgi:hypothetical protein